MLLFFCVRIVLHKRKCKKYRVLPNQEGSDNIVTLLATVL